MSLTATTGATQGGAYTASRIKRRRATKAEMEERAEFLINYADAHGPISVRGLYYQAEVRCIPGITKDNKDYDKIQRQVLQLRREGRLAYEHIADATRWMRKPRSFNGVEAALRSCATSYRKALWADTDAYVEIWVEKDALASVIFPVTSKYDAPLMVTRGFTSETFAYEAIAERADDDRPYYVYYLGDFDRAGVDAARTLQEKLERFGDDEGVEITFQSLAVTEWQVRDWNLPTREPKRKSAADKRWEYDFACELDAIEPDRLRDLVEGAINLHLPQHKLRIAKIAVASEREIISRLVGASS
jgi:hypothetical protein